MNDGDNNSEEKNDDDKVKNGVKTYIWGNFYWYMWHLMAQNLNNFDSEFAEFVKFLMLSPQDLLPCMHCRKSFESFTKMEPYDIEMFIKYHSLPEYVYIIHNAVNRKLNKEQQQSDIIKQYEHLQNMDYENYFWLWIHTIAFNFPADIQFIDYWNDPLEKHKFTFPDDSVQAKELKKRLKTYILFFDLLKNFIDRRTPLFQKWVNAYFQYTPTPFTFSCRTQLLSWIHKMQQACEFNANESFVDMLEELHPTRAL